jgi:lipid-binding SYLF domain-containing protein
MKKITWLPALVLAALATSAQAQDPEDVQEATELFRSIPEVARYFEDAYGYAVWPRIARGGLGIGASRGRGAVFVGGQRTGTSTLTEVSIGFQAGGQAYRQIVFFEDKETYDHFTGDTYEFDASASAVAVTASAQAGTSTQGTSASAGAGNPNSAVGVGYTGGMQVFTMAEGGLMYKATIAGQKYNFDAAE